MTHSITQSKTTAKSIIKFLLAALFWVGVWELVYLLVGHDTIVASPWQTLLRVIELGSQGNFWLICLKSIASIVVGYLCGIAAGGLFAVLSNYCTGAQTLLSPLLHVVRATPVASFILLAYFWMQTKNIPAFIAFLIVLPIIWGNTHEGLRSCDPQLLEMGRVYGFSRLKTLWQIRLPAAVPYFLSGCRTALGLAWKSGVAAQALVRPDNTIGNELQNAKIALETVDIFAWTAVVIVLSVLLERTVMLIFDRVRKPRKGASS
ncbi:MAG: ABC transporter permease subunit [Clostridia bacterium]|nr:ABC transporter permease subunit [Clostridia bacterium]